MPWFCERFEEVVAADGRRGQRCLDCGEVYFPRVVGARITAPCVDYKVPDPKVPSRLQALTDSLRRWWRAGRPMVGVVRFGRRLWRGCRRCPLRKRGTCTECGCLVMLKAALGSEACPIGVWHVEDPRLFSRTDQDAGVGAGPGCGCGGTN